MTLKNIYEQLSCKVLVVTKEWENREVGGVIAGDLMSEVLVNESVSPLLVSSLNSEQVVRTADIVDACAVLLVNGKKPQYSVVELARETNIPLFSTELSMYKACAALAALEGA